MNTAHIINRVIWFCLSFAVGAAIGVVICIIIEITG